MPFVRYARDKRGYETLYVMHVFEGEGRGRPRVLYACRTVPYARVGRAPLDDSVQRRIETAYPSLAFDWPRLLKEAAASAPRPEKPDTRNEPRKGRGRDRERKPKESRPAARTEPRTEPRPEPRTEPRPEPRAETRDAVPPGPDVPPVPQVQFEPVSEAPEPETRPAERAEPQVPQTPQTPQVPQGAMVLPALEVDRSWPAVGALGEMRTLVLRGRYIELANRVLSRVSDAGEQRRLWNEAARLNPESWKTAEHARDAVAGFDAEYEAIAARIRQQPAV